MKSTMNQFNIIRFIQGFAGGSDGKESPAMQETQV